MHKPLRLEGIGLAFGQKTCFEDFTALVHPGGRIGIIGRNGSGKTCLLKIIAGIMPPSEGKIITDGAQTAYVPQTVLEHDDLSGGQRFNKALTAAMAQRPGILLLDEPTNHLDAKNRAGLMALLRHWRGTLIAVSHDRELLNTCVDTLWNIDGGKIDIFNGNFDDYTAQRGLERAVLEGEISELSKQKRAAHQALMQEQQRAKKSRVKGEKAAATGKWAPIIAGGMKRMAQVSAGAKNKDIRGKREDIAARLSSLRLPEIIKPKFSLTPAQVSAGAIVVVEGGAVGYGGKIVLDNINLTLGGKERLAVCGPNASGKTTLIKALLGDETVKKNGAWQMPPPKDTGLLDQHYKNLPQNSTVFETLRAALPTATRAEIRDFLNDFLFRKNEEVDTEVKNLSGGERARLSLALIAARTPKLLVLDEPANNIDYETRQHIIQVLQAYPAALIAVSHDEDFLNQIGAAARFNTER